jgi:hypothetical protein
MWRHVKICTETLNVGHSAAVRCDAINSNSKARAGSLCLCWVPPWLILLHQLSHSRGSEASVSVRYPGWGLPQSSPWIFPGLYRSTGHDSFLPDLSQSSAHHCTQFKALTGADHTFRGCGDILGVAIWKSWERYEDNIKMGPTVSSFRKVSGVTCLRTDFSVGACEVQVG